MSGADIHIELRPATLADADLLLEWRNDPATRAASFRPEPIRPADHYAWLERTLAADDRRLLVAELAGSPIGTVRADRLSNAWQLSWTVAPEARGNGYAAKMVAMVADEIDAAIQADVKYGNIASVKVAEHAGMTLVTETDDHQRFFRPAKKN